MAFTTRNRLDPGRSMGMSLVDGPFESLEGRWDFTPVGGEGTRAELRVRFETRGVAGAIALGPAFEAACNQLVDAFARRAREVFGGA
ncbi:Ribosome association toxin RatA [compost metagenome]